MATTVTKKVVSNDDGLLCAEIIREFLDFYQMKHSLHVFVPEMSLPDFPKGKNEIEREIGMADRDTSKPLLLRLIEQVKFGAAAPSTQTFGSNPLRQGSTEVGSLQAPEQNASPDPTTRKENTKNSKKDAKKKTDKTKKPVGKKEPPTPPNPTGALTNLADLPGLGKPGAGPKSREEDSGGFDDFDFE